MEIDIRQVNTETVGVLADILREAAQWLEDTGKKNWEPSKFTPERILHDNDINELYICYVDNNAAGCIKLQEIDDFFWPDDEPGEAMYVHKLAVKRQFAGKGISTYMLEWARDQAKTRGYKTLKLDCIADRKKLCEFYATQGFRKVDEKQVFGYSPSARFEYVVNV